MMKNIIIKIADRLRYMRTIEFRTKFKQKNICVCKKGVKSEN